MPSIVQRLSDHAYALSSSRIRPSLTFRPLEATPKQTPPSQTGRERENRRRSNPNGDVPTTAVSPQKNEGKASLPRKKFNGASKQAMNVPPKFSIGKVHMTMYEKSSRWGVFARGPSSLVALTPLLA